MPSSTDLLDANVRLALGAEAHTHPGRAKAYWHNEAAPMAAFCRVTEPAFLRHLTNRAIMGEHVLTPSPAWQKRTQFLSLPEVQRLAEPSGLDEQLARFCDLGRTSPNLWTDAYLAAMAKCACLRLVSFDPGFARFSGSDLLFLQEVAGTYG